MCVKMVAECKEDALETVAIQDTQDRVFVSLLVGGYLGFHAENPFRSVIERHLGFLRRALPGTSRRARKSREGGGGGKRKTACSKTSLP